MIKILKNTILFKNISENSIKNILDKITFNIKKYEVDEQIAFREDKVTGLYIILKGKISTEMLTENGNIIKIEELVTSDIIAPAFIFGDNNIFPVDLKAIIPTEIFYIEKTDFLKLLSLEEKLLENFLNEISNKTQLLTNKIWSNFNNKTIKKKLINYIKKNSKDSIFYVKNLNNLAETFGVERPSVSRVLGNLIKEKRIEKIGIKKYKILDIDFFNH